jgi:hypothetical protein
MTVVERTHPTVRLCRSRELPRPVVQPTAVDRAELSKNSPRSSKTAPTATSIIQFEQKGAELAIQRAL